MCGCIILYRNRCYPMCDRFCFLFDFGFHRSINDNKFRATTKIETSQAAKRIEMNGNNTTHGRMMNTPAKWKIKIRLPKLNEKKTHRVEQRWQINNIPRKENQNDTPKENMTSSTEKYNIMFALFTCTFRLEMFLLCAFFSRHRCCCHRCRSAEILRATKKRDVSKWRSFALSLSRLKWKRSWKLIFFACLPAFSSPFSG